MEVYKMEEELDSVRKSFVTDLITQSFNIEQIVFDGDEMHFEYSDRVDPDEIKKKIKMLIYISQSIEKDIVYEHESDKSYEEDPTTYLMLSGDVKKISDGMFLFQGAFLRVVQAIDKYLYRQADSLKAVEQEYPILWPVELYKNINYFKEFPQHVILCTTVKSDYISKKKFADKYDKTKDYQKIQLDSDFLSSPTYGLGSSVCDCCYFALENRTDNENKYYTTCNKVFRNEILETGGLDRLINYTVRDIMAVGEKEFVLYARQCFLDIAVKFVKDMELDCKIESANDPFFSNESVVKNVFQYASKLKYEILARIPHLGKRIAVGSINLHLDFFGKSFNIRQEDHSVSHSACMGIGFERFAYALFAQYGHDVSTWPKTILKKLEMQ